MRVPIKYQVTQLNVTQSCLQQQQTFKLQTLSPFFS